MNIDNLKEIISILNNLLKKKSFSKDKYLIEEIIFDINKLILVKDNISINSLEVLTTNMDTLKDNHNDKEVDKIYNLYIPIYSLLKDNIPKVNSEETLYKYDANIPNYYNIRHTFDRLLGLISTASVYSDYKEYNKEYRTVLKIIAKWSATYEVKRNLFFITREELLDIYYELQDLNDECIERSSSLSDEIFIWYYNLMLIRKAEIEKLG